MPPPIHTETLPNGHSFNMIYAEGGSFMMGSEAEEAFLSEQPVHKVTLQDFYIGEFPVTQALWKAVMGEENTPSYFRGNERPVETVSWEDTQKFIRKLNQMTSRTYRLLTEAEWEYAARGGPISRGFKYAGSDKLREVGWYVENGHWETKAVGLKDPNELGLYDMSGNVYEWVEDQYHGSYENAPDDGSAWVDREEGAFRVIRGGSWYGDPRLCRATCRGDDGPGDRDDDVGFRLGFPLQ